MPGAPTSDSNAKSGFVRETFPAKLSVGLRITQSTEGKESISAGSLC